MHSILNSERQIAEYLLEIKAVILKPQEPFTWASGWKSPIYCDNRLIMSYPKVRNVVRDAFISRMPDEEINGIVGVATGGIAHAAFVADAMQLPMSYVRSGKKGHGRQNQIEGKIGQGDKVVVIEDLVSTGGSSLQAVEAVRSTGAEVVQLAAVFTYGFAVSENAMNDAQVAFSALTNYPVLLEMAIESGIINKDDVVTLNLWRKSPETWGQ